MSPSDRLPGAVPALKSLQCPRNKESRVWPQEAPRIFPVGGGEWSWWIPVILIGICVFFAILGGVKKALEQKPWWNTLLVMGGTLLLAAVFAARHRDADFTYLVVMLVPSFSVIGLLYLAVVGIMDERK
jgi:hypothetical protein